MRNIVLEHQGGAIVASVEKAPAAPAATEADRSQLEAAGKPRLAPPYVNLHEIITEAHRARAEEVARLARKLIAWLKEGTKRAMQSDAERYLAQATDLADVERRLQQIMRGERCTIC
jgi:hypothetical protein